MTAQLRKYPRTRHIEGSRLQPGDEGLGQVPWKSLADSYLVVEEKIDGANSAVSFADDGTLLLQSRGHYLTGGRRERHFALFKSWAATHRDALWDVLGDRYILYGEWVYARHTIFYDRLPHYFLEFDLLDRAEDVFLDTVRRGELLAGAPVVAVPVLRSGLGRDLGPPAAMVGPSLFKSAGWRERLREQAREEGLDVELSVAQTDPSDDAEGLYVKVEDGGAVRARLKWIRPSFLTRVLESESHWLDRPILPNVLDGGVDLFAS